MEDNCALNLLVIPPFRIEWLIHGGCMFQPQSQNFGQRLENVLVSMGQRTKVVVDDKLRGLASQATAKAVKEWLYKRIGLLTISGLPSPMAWPSLNPGFCCNASPSNSALSPTCCTSAGILSYMKRGKYLVWSLMASRYLWTMTSDCVCPALSVHFASKRWACH